MIRISESRRAARVAAVCSVLLAASRGAGQSASEPAVQEKYEGCVQRMKGGDREAALQCFTEVVKASPPETKFLEKAQRV